MGKFKILNKIIQTFWIQRRYKEHSDELCYSHHPDHRRYAGLHLSFYSSGSK